MNAADRFIKLVQHPIKFKLFLLTKLPSAFFCGVRVQSISEENAVVTVPYKWLSQNPFKSTYFACLAMAAEMSTGLLSMMNTYQQQPAISMLVTGLEASYFKKTTIRTYFTCQDGAAIKNCIEEAIKTGNGVSIKAKSTGRNAAGEAVADFYITWSFKAKGSR